MNLGPYRTPARSGARPPPLQRLASYDVAIVVAVVWTLGVVRVLFALLRHEAPGEELDLAWLFILLGPLVLWKEITAERRR